MKQIDSTGESRGKCECGRQCQPANSRVLVLGKHCSRRTILVGARRSSAANQTTPCSSCRTLEKGAGELSGFAATVSASAGKSIPITALERVMFK